MSAKILGIVLLLLLIANSVVWYVALNEDHRGILSVTFLSTAQGDTVFVEAPSGRTILIDGGPDASILRALGSVMPFYDRSIDMVIATAQTPEKIGGLASVLPRYSVSVIVRSASISSTPQAQSFAGAVSNAQQNGARLLTAKRGQVIELGDGAFIEFFFPDRDASQMSASDGCLMFKLVFGQTSFFFACGSPTIETYVAMLDGAKLRSDVLLATGEDPELFAGFVSPQFVIMPCGSAATTSAFTKLQIQTLDECDGNVTFVSNGETVLMQ